MSNLVILDLGSGNTCRNDFRILRDMIDAIAVVDTERRTTLKMQLWSHGTEPQCTKLNWSLFKRAFVYAESRGFRTTASVFDVEALRYLLTFDVPFVKIANRPYLRHLARYVPRGIPIITSMTPSEIAVPSPGTYTYTGVAYDTQIMICVSNYPAIPVDYEAAPKNLLYNGISDHTVGLDLWRRYRPAIYEKHFVLDTSTGPDAGPWALRPADLSEFLRG